MAETRSILYKFIADTKGLEKGTKRAQSSFGGLKKAAVGLGIAIGGAELARFAGDAIQAAISADEAASKFGTVFSESIEDANREMEEWADKAGVARDRAQDLWGTVGNLLGNTGLGSDAVVDFSDDIADLAGDIASFNDADPSQVFQELGTAITTTERESLKKYGITVSENEVKQRALNRAIADGRDEANEADRAFASYEIALEGAGQAVGDLDRTSESLANRQRRLNARWRDAQVELGRALLPAVEELMPLLEEGVDVFADLAKGLGPVIKALADTVGLVEDSREAWAGLFSSLEESGNEGFERFSRVWSNLFSGAIPGAIATLGEVADFFGWLGDEVKETADQVSTADARFEDIEAVEERRRAIEEAEQKHRDLSEAIEETMEAEWEWSRSDALEEVRRKYELLASAGGVGRDRLARQRSVAQQGGILDPYARGYQTGGVVPGSGPRMAVVHGGERITPPSSRGGGGGGVTVVVNMGVVGDPAAAADAVVDLLDYYERVNGPRPSGLGYGS